jgi:hypothetical protein
LKFQSTILQEVESRGADKRENEMIQWALEHPYLFFTMFLFSLVTMVSITAEISNSIASCFAKNVAEKEKSTKES